MKYSAAQAAEAVGKTTPTNTKAIKTGKMSAEKAETGGYLIDPSELYRVFPPLTSGGNVTPQILGYETPNERGALQAEIEALRERLVDKDDVIADLRKRLDSEGEERRRLTALLVDARTTPTQTVPAEPPRRGWWPFTRRRINTLRA